MVLLGVCVCIWLNMDTKHYNTLYIYIFTFIHLVEAFIQSDLQLLYIRVNNCPVFPGQVLFSNKNITIFYPYRGDITYFKCIEINKVSLSKLRVSFE